jgi:hypothetical protein
MIGTLLLLGFFAGYRLSSIPNLQTYKLLNLVGLIYAFLGVLVLSEILAVEGWKNFCVKKLAPSVSWIQTVVPFGALVGSSIAAFRGNPSGSLVALFSLSFWGYSLLVVMPLNEIVVLPQLPFIKKDVETRWRWLGFLLVLGGVGAQLVAGVLDVRQ